MLQYVNFYVLSLSLSHSLSLSPSLLCHRIIEVEPSVNIDSGQNTEIVQVRDNKIIGRRVDQPLLSPDHIQSRGSRETSPFRSPGRHQSPSPSTGSATSQFTVIPVQMYCNYSVYNIVLTYVSLIEASDWFKLCTCTLYIYMCIFTQYTCTCRWTHCNVHACTCMCMVYMYLAEYCGKVIFFFNYSI